MAFALLLATAALSKFGGPRGPAPWSARAGDRRLRLAREYQGLTELIVLGIGLQIGVIDQRLYSVMVLVAVATAAMASPLLSGLMGTNDGVQDRPTFLVDFGSAWGDSSGT